MRFSPGCGCCFEPACGQDNDCPNVWIVDFTGFSHNGGSPSECSPLECEAINGGTMPGISADYRSLPVPCVSFSVGAFVTARWQATVPDPVQMFCDYGAGSYTWNLQIDWSTTANKWVLALNRNTNTVITCTSGTHARYISTDAGPTVANGLLCPGTLIFELECYSDWSGLGSVCEYPEFVTVVAG